MIGGIFDVLIYFYADRLNLYEEEDDELDEKPKLENDEKSQEMKIHDNVLESMDIENSIENLRKVSEC